MKCNLRSLYFSSLVGLWSHLYPLNNLSTCPHFSQVRASEKGPLRKKAVKWSSLLDIVAHACNFSSGERPGQEDSEFHASLGWRVTDLKNKPKGASQVGWWIKVDSPVEGENLTCCKLSFDLHSHCIAHTPWPQNKHYLSLKKKKKKVSESRSCLEETVCVHPCEAL